MSDKKSKPEVEDESAPSVVRGRRRKGEFADGQTRIAAVLQKHFRTNGYPDFTCTRQYIRHWEKPTTLRRIGFPPATDGNRYKISDCIAWVHKYIIAHGITNDEEANLFERANTAVAKTKILKGEDFELDVGFKRGKLISVDLIRNYVGGIGARISGHYDKLIEDRQGLRGVVKSCGAQAGISEEHLHILDSALAKEFVTANDHVKNEFRTLQEDAKTQIDEWINEQKENK